MDRSTILKDRDFQTLMLHARQYYKDGDFDNYTVTFKEMLEHIKGITDNANSKCKPGNLLSYFWAKFNLNIIFNISLVLSLYNLGVGLILGWGLEGADRTTYR
jgi:hypothetical protein